ncbi:anti-sigma F factor antagonist [Chengkuizengella marina]|uniref:Anti-sigma F factor antagonist n=1 Tax=Chengkuizengella marina TaxID=2507566 RepID=A0A6N9Q6E0_9BACL|nr:anti-sigma F factor antagonist [Chengkuizengella marina]NBI30407.1 anti-sigma F factor antagonist [Chengkuizengella marina]
MSLHVQISNQGEALIVRLQGELDHHTSELLRTKMESAIEQENSNHIVLVLKDLSFMDSSGLGVILGRYKQITNRGGRMVVCNVNSSIYRLFEMSGLFKILTIEEDEEQALSSLGVVS